jgi:hypothetical protein
MWKNPQTRYGGKKTSHNPLHEKVAQMVGWSFNQLNEKEVSTTLKIAILPQNQLLGLQLQSHI